MYGLIILGRRRKESEKPHNPHDCKAQCQCYRNDLRDLLQVSCTETKLHHMHENVGQQQYQYRWSERMKQNGIFEVEVRCCNE